MRISVLLPALTLFSLTGSAIAVNSPVTVFLEVKGPGRTVFRGKVTTQGHDITTKSGGTHHCDGTNNGAHPTPGPTCTSALDDASKKAGFKFDGKYFAQFDDFLIDKIAGISNKEFTDTSGLSWFIYRNGVQTEVGGCQEQVKEGDQILWRYEKYDFSSNV